jgi:dipeptidyl aminopeptidase/acylaminoacyl peptidase
MSATGDAVVAVRQPLEGRPAVVAVRGRHRRVLQPPGEPVATGCRWRIHHWRGPDGALEGILGTPATGGAPWPLVVDLHAGPWGGLAAGDPDHLDHLRGWCQHGFAAFAPEFRGSGILGRDPMLAALEGEGLPDDDREAHDVLSGVQSLLAGGLAEPERLFLFGHSYGADLVNRILTIDHRFAAAVCWEGVADLRLLDRLQGGSAAQRAWRGGSPQQVYPSGGRQPPPPPVWTGCGRRCCWSTARRAWAPPTGWRGSPRYAIMACPASWSSTRVRVTC